MGLAGWALRNVAIELHGVEILLDKRPRLDVDLRAQEVGHAGPDVFSCHNWAFHARAVRAHTQLEGVLMQPGRCMQ